MNPTPTDWRAIQEQAGDWPTRMWTDIQRGIPSSQACERIQAYAAMAFRRGLQVASRTAEPPKSVLLYRKGEVNGHEGRDASEDGTGPGC